MSRKAHVPNLEPSFPRPADPRLEQTFAELLAMNKGESKRDVLWTSFTARQNDLRFNMELSTHNRFLEQQLVNAGIEPVTFRSTLNRLYPESAGVTENGSVGNETLEK